MPWFKFREGRYILKVRNGEEFFVWVSSHGFTPKSPTEEITDGFHKGYLVAKMVVIVTNYKLGCNYN